MLFQYGIRGGGFTNILYYLQNWGVIDVILPFLLIFTILFAVLEKVKVLKERRFNVAISVGIALLVVIPHVMGTYPPGSDVVEIINTSIPEVALLFIAVVMVLLMLGLIAGRQITGGYMGTTLAIIAAGIVIMIFISAVSPIPLLMRIDPALQSLIVIMLIFGLIVYFVGRPERAPTEAELSPEGRAFKWWGPWPPPGTERGGSSP